VESPFQISIFDKAFVWKGVLGSPTFQSWTPRFNKLGTGEFGVAPTDPMLAFLYAPGARVRVTYKGEHQISGPVLHPSGPLATNGTVTFQVEDDGRALQNTLAWVNPQNVLTPTALTASSSAALAQSWLPDGPSSVGPDGTTQGQYGYMVWPVEVVSAESAVKWLVSTNAVGRLNRPITVAADLVRGGDAVAAGMLPQVRMGQLDEAVAELLEWSGLGLKLWHDGVNPTVYADVWAPTVWPQTLTVESGIVVAGEWSKQNPTATRIVVGGPGEDVARAFWGVTDAAREAEYGDIIEVFRDATGANLDWPSTLAEVYRVAKYYLLRGEVSAAAKTEFRKQLNMAAGRGLTEGAPTSGLSLELSETVSFFYGPGGFHVGDQITVESNGLYFTDRITECEMSETVEAGVIVTPRVGSRQDDPDTIFARSIERLAAAQRQISTSK